MFFSEIDIWVYRQKSIFGQYLHQKLEYSKKSIMTYSNVLIYSSPYIFTKTINITAWFWVFQENSLTYRLSLWLFFRMGLAGFLRGDPTSFFLSLVGDDGAAFPIWNTNMSFCVSERSEEQFDEECLQVSVTFNLISRVYLSSSFFSSSLDSLSTSSTECFHSICSTLWGSCDT